VNIADRTVLITGANRGLGRALLEEALRRGARDLDIPKASTESAARAIFDGVEQGADERFPDPMSEAWADGWRNSASKALERQLAA